MTTTDKRKRSLYFPDNILREMQSEAKRQERSLSWIVQYAWRIARAELMQLPSVGGVSEERFHAESELREISENDDIDDMVADNPHDHERFGRSTVFSPHNG